MLRLHPSESFNAGFWRRIAGSYPLVLLESYSIPFQAGYRLADAAIKLGRLKKRKKKKP